MSFSSNANTCSAVVRPLFPDDADKSQFIADTAVTRFRSKEEIICGIVLIVLTTISTSEYFITFSLMELFCNKCVDNE